MHGAVATGGDLEDYAAPLASGESSRVLGDAELPDHSLNNHVLVSVVDQACETQRLACMILGIFSDCADAVQRLKSRLHGDIACDVEFLELPQIDGRAYYRLGSRHVTVHGNSLTDVLDKVRGAASEPG